MDVAKGNKLKGITDPDNEPTHPDVLDLLADEYPIRRPRLS